MENTEQTTLRDSLTQAIEHVESGGSVPDAPDLETKETAKESPASSASSAVEKKNEKPDGRTSGRQRDDAGRLLPGKAEKQAAKPDAPIVPERKTIKLRDKDVEWWKLPSTWKKESAEYWERTPEQVMQEVHRRESDAAFGVSTYKAEYDAYKPIADVFKPYQPFLQQNNTTPDRYAKALIETDQVLRFGTAQQKLQNFVQLSQIYGIPLHEMFVQGEDGKVYFNQHHMAQPQQATQQQPISREDIRKMLDEERSNAYWASQIQTMKEAKDGSGNPAYPHFETLRQTMHGLLQSGLAKDLTSAYDAALRMPNHADIYDAQQNAKRETEDKARIQAKSAAAAKAKDAAVSVKSQSPTGKVEIAKSGRTSIRSSLLDAFDEHEGGRV